MYDLRRCGCRARAAGRESCPSIQVASIGPGLAVQQDHVADAPHFDGQPLDDSSRPARARRVKGGKSFISTDSGFSRACGMPISMAIKLTGPSGTATPVSEFNPSAFQAGTGSGEPALHPVSFGATWEWSAVRPNIIYYLSGSAIETYNTTSGASTPLASTPTGEPVTYMAAVIGL